MKKVFEIVYYTINEIEKENDFIESMNLLNTEVLPKINWFISRKMLKNEDGLFCDIILWDNLNDAKNALNNIMKNEISQKAFSYIKNDSVEMNYFEILSWTHENLDFVSGAVEIGTVKLNENKKINEVVDIWIEVRKNYLEKQSGFIAQFIIKNDDDLFWEIVFNKNNIEETKEICDWYFKDITAKKYISNFNPSTTKIKYWNIIQ